MLRRRFEGASLAWCSTNLESLVSRSMKEWGLTAAEMMKIPEVTDQDEVASANEDEMPATQPYPEDVHGVPEEALLTRPRTKAEIDAQAKANQAEEQGGSDDDSRPPANVNWGAAKFVLSALTADPRLLPGDIVDLEGRAAGLTSKYVFGRVTLICFAVLMALRGKSARVLRGRQCAVAATVPPCHPGSLEIWPCS